MKRRWKLLGCLAIGLVLTTTAPATDKLAGNPYAGIVVQNPFRLTLPPPKQERPIRQPPVLTPIRVQGIQDILYRRQVLLTLVLPPRVGEAQMRELVCIMNEGERYEEVVVVRIDFGSRRVLFLNHGVEQWLALDTAPPPANDPQLGLPPVNVRLPEPVPSPRVPDAPPLSADDQVILIEVNRELTKDEVLRGELPPLPPTALTPPDAPGVLTRPQPAPE